MTHLRKSLPRKFDVEEVRKNTYKLNELLAKGMPEIEWLVKDFIPSRGITFFAGESQSYKSWTAMELALSVATGTTFLGMFETKQRRVLYIDEENGDITIPVRFNQLLQGKEGLDQEIEAPDNLHISIFNDVNIDQSPEVLKLLIEEINPELVIIDSVVRCMRGNENDSEDVRSIYDNLKKIYKEKEELAFVLLHHMTKTNSGTLHSLRGSGDFGAMAENVINFVKQETYVSSGFKLKVTKNRHIAGNPMYEVLVVSDGATGPVTITAIGEIHRQNRTRERDKVKEAILQDCKVGDILDTSSESELMRKLIEQEFKKSTISDAIKELRDIDQIIRQKKRGEYEVIRTIKDDNVDNLSQNNLSSYTK